jgi:hypothetical protein
MEISDFVREFNSLHICRLFHSVKDGGKWHKLSVPGEWSSATHSANGYDKTSKEPQIKFTLKNPADVHATLTLDYSQRNSGGENEEGDGCLSPVIGLFLIRAPKSNKDFFNNNDDDGMGNHGNNKACIHKLSKSFAPVQAFRRLNADDVIASSSPFTNLPTVSLSASNVQPSEDGYILLATTTKPNMFSKFTVTLYVDYQFESSIVE